MSLKRIILYLILFLFIQLSDAIDINSSHHFNNCSKDLDCNGGHNICRQNRCLCEDGYEKRRTESELYCEKILSWPNRNTVWMAVTVTLIPAVAAGMCILAFYCILKRRNRKSSSNSSTISEQDIVSVSATEESANFVKIKKNSSLPSYEDFEPPAYSHIS